MRHSSIIYIYLMLMTLLSLMSCENNDATKPTDTEATESDTDSVINDSESESGSLDDTSPHGDTANDDSDSDSEADSETQTDPEIDTTIVKVFILAGQSNMVGKGTVSPNADQLAKNGGMGTLKYLVEDASQKPTYDHLANNQGDWVVRDDVWLADLESSGPLTVNGRSTFGPELQFGFVMAQYYENPVLLIKTSWGGKSLAVDFRPPSSGGTVGEYYTHMIERVHEVLNNIDQYVPGYEGQGYEIAGFGWHQGWNDRVNPDFNTAYQENCVNLINDLRTEFKVPEMPFVIATTGMSGWQESHPRACSLMRYQLAVPDDPGLKGGNAITVDTRDFFRQESISPAGANQAFHWHWNAETLFLIGNSMAEAMITLRGDGTGLTDECPNNPDKMKPGKCGCDTPDRDRDNDGKPDCIDDVPLDPPPADQCT